MKRNKRPFKKESLQRWILQREQNIPAGGESECYNDKVLRMTETGRIIKIVSSRYEVLGSQPGTSAMCAMGKLRKAHSPVVGDMVEFERFANQNGIQKILPRKNALVRPSIANVDQAIIVMSCKDPDFSTTLIDRLIFSVCYAKYTQFLHHQTRSNR